MRKLPGHDLHSVIIPLSILLLVGSWQANYAMIYPLKSVLAGLAGIGITFYGFHLRYLVLSDTNGKDRAETWKSGNQFVIIGLGFCCLHPVAITVAVAGAFLYKLPAIPKIQIREILRYEAWAWIETGSLIFLMHLVHDYTVWNKFHFQPLPMILYSLFITGCLYLLFSGRSSKA